MAGKTNLEEILKTLRPELQVGEYVFCCFTEMPNNCAAEAIMWFRESEGITLIVAKEMADKNGWPYSFVAAWITLTVHSSLEAVGLTAAFSTALANSGISCNVVAGFYHDHLFVPITDAERAMKALQKIPG
ncbi:MAG: ACT domain-containing protein [Prolixibacteraceae bacterium]|nr:ACT domain-containing protein [Prolixibacteraceae bacterium]